jgi:hypothetical protein
MNEDFPFAVTEDARKFCRRVVEALVTFCDKPEPEAIALVRVYWSNQTNLESDPILYEEPPYYYAMCIAHHPKIGDGNIGWYQDPGLWPPPQGWVFE